MFALFTVAALIAGIAYSKSKQAKKAKKGLLWTAFIVGVVAGFLLAASSGGSMLTDVTTGIHEYVPLGVAAFLALIIAVDVVADREPDGPAVVAGILLPTVLVPGLTGLIAAAPAVGAAFSSWGQSLSGVFGG